MVNLVGVRFEIQWSGHSFAQTLFPIHALGQRTDVGDERQVSVIEQVAQFWSCRRHTELSLRSGTVQLQKLISRVLEIATNVRIVIVLVIVKGNEEVERIHATAEEQVDQGLVVVEVALALFGGQRSRSPRQEQTGYHHSRSSDIPQKDSSVDGYL